MKRTLRNIYLFSLLLILTFDFTQAQINRTLETKVVDVLAQLPTEDLEHSDRLMREVIALGETGILEFTNRLLPAGAGNDVQARYLVNSLSIYAGRGTTQEDKELVESTLRKAIEATESKDVKIFLMERLIFCASDESVGFLSDYLDDDDYYKTALAVLETIGTDTAASAVFRHLDKAEKGRQYAMVESLGKMR